MGGARSKGGKNVVDFRLYVTRSIPVGARIVCAEREAIVSANAIVADFSSSELTTSLISP